MTATNMQQEISCYVRAKYPCIAVRSVEEIRIEKALAAVAKSLNMGVRLWSIAQGFTALDGSAQESVQDPTAALQSIATNAKPCLYILRDFHPFIDPANASNVPVIRMVREMARVLKIAKREQARTAIFLGPKLELPEELKSEMAVLDWPLPTLDELGAALSDIVERLPPDIRAGLPADLSAIVAAAQGLTLEEASNCFARSLVLTRTLDPKIISAEKKMIVSRSGAAEWLEPLPGGLANVGGLDVLKSWAVERRLGFSPKAREYGLSEPKGVLVVGVPGTGKSLAVGCIAEAWGYPLIGTSADRMSGGLVGESESKTRQVFLTAEAVSPCILRFDEMEKLFAGSSGSGEADGGVKKAVLGMTLSWMQEKKKPVFVAATANEVESLPPELLRKGRSTN